MNDSIQENSELLQWDVMRGTYSQSATDAVQCHWERHLRKYVCQAGRNDFFDSHNVSLEWEERDPHKAPADVQFLRLPGDEWHFLDDGLVETILGRESPLQTFSADARSLSAPCFLGFVMPEAEHLCLYAYEDDDDNYDDAFYSSEGLNLLDLGAH